MKSLSLKFIARIDRDGESICSTCFRTIRATEAESLQQAQEKHQCDAFDLKALHWTDGTARR